jgi:BirA family biotin operon repressor/biotin-[acetyl-CoA-carboxylase] ligase
MHFTNIVRRRVIASTNDFLREHYHSIPHGTVVVADTQTRGRGRFRRRWQSGRGGLWFSILLKQNHVGKTFLLTFAAAVSVVKAVRGLGLPAVVKWPNDVLLSNRKVCGILTENIIKGSSVVTIVGIGINVNNRVDLESATTLKAELGKEADKELLLRRCLLHYSHYCAAYRRKDYSTILRDWRRCWGAKGEEVRVSTINGLVSGTAVGVDDEGDLVVRTKKGGRVVVVEGDLM